MRPKTNPDKLTDREHAFIMAHLAGASLVDAYIQAGYKCTTQTAAWSNSARLAKRPRVAKAMAAERERLRTKTALDLDGIVGFLTDVILAAPGRMDGDSHLCQDYHVTEGELGSSTRIKLPDKIAAVKHLTFLLGFDPAKKQELSTDSDLKALLLSLRGGG